MERRDTNLDTLLKRPTPSDIVLAIFVYSWLPKFTDNPGKIQEFIRERKDGEAADLLKPFVFSDEKNSYPLFSETLAAVVQGLTLSQAIYTLAPEYHGYYMDKEHRADAIRKIGARFSLEQITILKRLGQEWRKFNKDLERSERLLPAVL